MALKTKEGKPEAPPSDTTVLELALYTNYTYQGTTFQKGKPYRFKNADAMQLLSEVDQTTEGAMGRQIWRIYHPPAKPSGPKSDIVDATALEVPEPYEEPLPGHVTTMGGKKRIEVGTDDEIADILQKVEDDGNVTV